jgi:hypothetical protein
MQNLIPKEIRSVIKVINEYDPVLYMDIHVTDGADYQYDIHLRWYWKTRLFLTESGTGWNTHIKILLIKI